MKPIRSICLAALLLTGCKTREDFAPYLSQTLTVSIYASGRITRQWSISSQSTEHQLLADWLRAHQTGWKKSWVTYAPRTLASGTNFNMNIHPSGLIINARGKQYERDAPVADFRFLGNAPGT